MGAALCDMPGFSRMQQAAMPPTRDKLADSLTVLWRVLPAETGATEGIVVLVAGACDPPPNWHESWCFLSC